MSESRDSDQKDNPEANQDNPSQLLHDKSALALIRSAQASIPAFKYVIGFAAAAALLGIVLRVWENPAVLALGAVLLVLGGVLIRIFGRAVEIRGKRINFAAEILLYYVLAIVVFSVTMLITSLFFNTPIPIRSKLFEGHSVSRSEPDTAAAAVETAEAQSSIAGPEASTTIDSAVADPAGESVEESSETEKITTLKQMSSLEEAEELVQNTGNGTLAIAQLKSDLTCSLGASGVRLGSLRPSDPQVYIAPQGTYTFSCQTPDETKSIIQELKGLHRKDVVFNFEKRFSIVRGGTALVDDLHRHVWQLRDAGQGLSFDDAKAYCRGLNVDSSTHWGLPTVDELQTLFLGSGLTSNHCNKDPEADEEAQRCYMDKRFVLNSYSYWTGDWPARAPAPLVVDFLDRGGFGQLDFSSSGGVNGIMSLTTDGAKDAAYGVLCIDNR